MVSRRSFPFLAVLVLAAALRFYHLNLPLVEPYNSQTRQGVSAMIVRNMYQHGFNLFYPELDENGRGPYLFNAEMPVYAFLMALGYKIAGGVHEWAVRGVAALLSMGTLLLLYGLIRRRAGEKEALCAGFFFALSPMSVALARAVQPDGTMLFASVAALYSFDLYLENKNAFYLICSAASMGLAVLTKAYVLYLFIPLFYLAWEREGTGLFKNWRYYLYAAAVASTLSWYVYMWMLGRGQELAYSTISYASGRGAAYTHFWQILSPAYLNAVLKVFALHLLTPVGAVLFALGFFSKVKGEAERFFYAWFFSVVFFMGVFWRTAVEHSYYQLPFVPVCAFFVGKGFCVLGESRFGAVLKKPAVFVFFAALALAVPLYLYKGLYFLPPQNLAVVEAGRAVDRLSPKDSLVAAASETNPSQLIYYSGRKGWKFDLSEKSEALLIERLEECRKQGAGSFVTAELTLLRQRPLFEKHLRDHYPILEETDRYIVFRLPQTP